MNKAINKMNAARSNMNKITSDVIIVGGGLMGTSTAFFLRQRGHKVTLLERGLVGQQASGTNFGNLRRQGRSLPELQMAQRANDIWQRSEKLLGTDVEYLKSGHLRVSYSQADVDKMEEYARQARPLGLELEMISGAQLRKRFPYLSTEVLGGSYSAEDGQANPRLVAPAFARAAKRNGVEVFENTHIIAVEKEGADFRVTSDHGRRFEAPILLLTAGAWGNVLSSQFREPVPLTSFGPTMSVTEPVTYSIRPSIGVYTTVERESVYFRQIPRGNIIIGGSIRSPGYPNTCRTNVKPQNTLSQLEQIRRIVPKLGRLNIIRVWTGTEGYLPDSLPVIGPSEKVSGLYYAFGFSGSGFQIGPGVGDVMAELIDTGATDVPLDSFRVGRFAAS